MIRGTCLDISITYTLNTSSGCFSFLVSMILKFEIYVFIKTKVDSLCPSQHVFSYVGMGLPGLNQN